MKPIEITSEDIQHIKQFLKTKTYATGLTKKKTSFIRHYSRKFFLGGENLYRKTSSGSEIVIGPVSINCNSFLDCIYKAQEKEPAYKIPADSPFANW